MSDAQDESVVQITAAASARATALLDRAGLSGGGLRVRVQSSGCDGFVALLDLAAGAEPAELTVTAAGVRLYVDIASMLALPGATLDHRATAHGSEFVWTHPSSTGECRCAEARLGPVGAEARLGPVSAEARLGPVGAEAPLAVLGDND